MEVETALKALEELASSPSTSSSGPLESLLSAHFGVARERIIHGSDPKSVILELQKNVAKAKKDAEKGLKAWYTALNGVGKQVDKVSRLSS